jgi:hypothetical protein
VERSPEDPPKEYGRGAGYQYSRLVGEYHRKLNKDFLWRLKPIVDAVDAYLDEAVRAFATSEEGKRQERERAQQKKREEDERQRQIKSILDRL